VFNSNNKTNCGASGQNTPCYSYYSWIAATLGAKQVDGITVEDRDGYNAVVSICPKGWRLPTSTTSNAPATTSPNWKTGDWYALATAYGANLENRYYDDSSANTNFYSQAGPTSAVPKFLLAGYYNSGAFDHAGNGGHYWSSTFGSGASTTYDLGFYPTIITSASRDGRKLGFSVRCILNNGSSS
jgi:uncharacterized protein (TIGR02145 family)